MWVGSLRVMSWQTYCLLFSDSLAGYSQAKMETDRITKQISRPLTRRLICGVMLHRADAKVDTYSSFADLAAHEVRGRDYDLLVRHRNGTRVVIIAPHGGGIEPETARIAKGIAGAEFSLYCFKGLKRNGNGRLHIKIG